MTARYEPDTTKSFYNAWGAREWDRLDSSFENRVNYRIHREILAEHVTPGAEVLEAGAGPGRFTIEMARIGAKVTACDLSDVQLAVNREKVTEAGLDGQVTGWHQADIVDLSQFDSDRYDAVVCVGSVLSCVLDRAPQAVSELVRTCKPGGIIVLSVTSRHGYVRAFLKQILALASAGEAQLSAVDAAVRSGDVVGIQADIELLTTHFFTWGELRDLLVERDCEIVTASASNFFSADDPELDAALAGKTDLMDAFLSWELEACRAPGAIDGGTHIIAVARKRG
jgi:2-polyprenyl-3-methyl-5-hydroxy-6-metoxy-1,4-benzoquinol methylase